MNEAESTEEGLANFIIGFEIDQIEHVIGKMQFLVDFMKEMVVLKKYVLKPNQKIKFIYEKPVKKRNTPNRKR